MNNAFRVESVITSVSVEPDAKRTSAPEIAANDERDYLHPRIAEDKWPAWKTTSFILITCGAFWTAVVLLVSRLF